MEIFMEEIFPQTLFISQGGSGEDVYLSAFTTEESAIKATDDEQVADVAEYQLVVVRKRMISTSVVDA